MLTLEVDQYGFPKANDDADILESRRGDKPMSAYLLSSFFSPGSIWVKCSDTAALPFSFSVICNELNITNLMLLQVFRHKIAGGGIQNSDNENE